MNKGDLCGLLSDAAKAYAESGPIDSVVRNIHMHGIPAEQVAEVGDERAKAIVVDFVNFVAMRQVIDLALYTADLDRD